LVQLNLNSNQIGDTGVAELSKALAANNTLTTVCAKLRIDKND